MECNVLNSNPIKNINGIIRVEGDKSISHRSIMLGSISIGKTIIEGLLESEDVISTINIFKELGVSINKSNGKYTIDGVGLKGLRKSKKALYAGNSGTTIRLMSGILVGQNFDSKITGDESIRKRPMKRIIEPLRLFGANIKGVHDDFAPIEILGSNNLRSIEYKMKVDSAQVKSSIILASLYSKGDTIIFEKNKSRDHTERMVNFLGGDISANEKKIIVKPSILEGRNINIPGDISSAAFFIALAAAVKGSNIIIRDVGVNETRIGIIDIIKAMGGKVNLLNKKLVSNEMVSDIEVIGADLKGVSIKGEMIPKLIDEIPVIAVIASVASGVTKISGAEELKVKESNRIKTTINELSKIGVKIKELDDGMEIQGGQKIIGGVVESHNDHRIAMAMAVAGALSKNGVKINNSECINISFPRFEKILKEVSIC